MTKIRALAILVSSFLLYFSPEAAAFQYFGPEVLPNGIFPMDVVAGDLDGDGKDDVVLTVLTSTISSETKIYYNAGGVVGGVSTVDPGLNPRVMTLADLNNDGRLDIASAGQPGLNADRISLKLNLGGGTFAPAQTYLLALATPTSICSADYNSDGVVDIVTSHPASGKVVFLPSVGVASYGIQRQFAAGLYPVKAIAADVTNDGKVDILVTNEYSGVQSYPAPVTQPPYIANNKVSVLAGNGAGGFAPFVSYTVGQGPADAAVADYNLDGLNDVATADAFAGSQATFIVALNMYFVSYTSNTTSSLLIANAGGGFQPSQQTIVGFPKSIYTSDWNQDGKPDLGFVDHKYSEGGNLRIFVNNSGWQLSDNYKLDGVRLGEIVDWNQDGAQDFIAVMKDYSQLAYPILVDANAQFMFHLEGIYQYIVQPGIACLNDLQNDGHVDLIVKGGTLQTTLPANAFSGDGLGHYSANPVFQSSENVLDITSSDLDADGFADLAGLSSPMPDRVHIWKNGGLGGFMTAATVSVTLPAPPDLWIGNICPADLDLNGLPDLVAATSKSVHTLMNQGSLQFQVLTPFTFATGYYENVLITDFNEDGMPDFICVHTTSSVLSAVGSGGGLFGTIAAVGDPNAKYTSVTYGDFNNDDHMDLIVFEQSVNPPQDGTRMLLGNGNGQFGVTPMSGPTGAVLSEGIKGADFNIDGFLDFVTASQTAKALSVALNNSSAPGNFILKDQVSDNYLQQWVLSADVNEDGFPDILSGHSDIDFNYQAVIIWPNRSLSPPGVLYFGTGTPGCAGVLGVNANKKPVIGEQDFKISTTNGPATSLGVALAGDIIDMAGSDYFGLHLKIYVDPYTSTSLLGFDILSDASGTTIASIPIPNDLGLVGQSFVYQSVFVADFARGDYCSNGIFELISSRALKITIQ